jgi:hypothetical protein
MGRCHTVTDRLADRLRADALTNLTRTRTAVAYSHHNHPITLSSFKPSLTDLMIYLTHKHKAQTTVPIRSHCTGGTRDGRGRAQLRVDGHWSLPMARHHVLGLLII